MYNSEQQSPQHIASRDSFSAIFFVEREWIMPHNCFSKERSAVCSSHIRGARYIATANGPMFEIGPSQLTETQPLHNKPHRLCRRVSFFPRTDDELLSGKKRRKRKRHVALDGTRNETRRMQPHSIIKMHDNQKVSRRNWTVWKAFRDPRN